MAKRIVLLLALLVALGMVPAFAGIVYSNNPVSTVLNNCAGAGTPPNCAGINGPSGGLVGGSLWTSDTFTVAGGAGGQQFLGSVTVDLWWTTSVPTALAYCFSDPEPDGTACAHSGANLQGNANLNPMTGIPSNPSHLATSGAYILDQFSFSLPALNPFADSTIEDIAHPCTTSGSTNCPYWLTLYNAVDGTDNGSGTNAGQDSIFWALIDTSGQNCTGDQNAGGFGLPTAHNGCPSGAGWTFHTGPTGIATQGNYTNNFSEAFQINDTGASSSSTPPPPSPEPASITLMGAGALLLGGLLRFKRK